MTVGSNQRLKETNNKPSKQSIINFRNLVQHVEL